MANEASTMKRRDFVLSIINECAGHKEFGRTSLQKVAYLAGVARGRDMGHRPHYFGPFSDVLEDDVEALVLSDLVREKAYGLGFANRAGLEAKKYEYEVSDTGKARMRDIESKYPQEIAALQSFIETLSAVARGLDQRILSPVAKTDFIARKQKRDLTSEEVAALAKRLGWDLPPNEVDRVGSLLHRLGFIKMEQYLQNRQL